MLHKGPVLILAGFRLFLALLRWTLLRGACSEASNMQSAQRSHIFANPYAQGTRQEAKQKAESQKARTQF